MLGERERGVCGDIEVGVAFHLWDGALEKEPKGDGFKSLWVECTYLKKA